MKILKLLDADMQRYFCWFRWTGWVALVGFYMVARFSDRLSWEAWESRMLYALGGLTFFILLFSMLALQSGRVPWTLLAVGLQGLAFARIGDVSDVTELRQTVVMGWSFTIALALLHEGALMRQPRSEPPDCGR